MAVDLGALTSFDLNDTTPITTNTGAVVLTLTAESLFPQGSVGGTPTVSSSDTSIATVSASAFVLNSDSTAVISDITITGVAIGTSTITVSFTDPDTVAHSVTATVTVEAPDYLDQSGLRHFWDKIKSLFIKNENGAVTTDLLANSAVTTAKIANSNVTAAKLASNSVETAKIANGAVTGAKINWNSIPSYQGIWSGSNPLGTSWTTELTVNISTPGTYALIGNVRTANRKGSSTGFASRIKTNGTKVMSAEGRWWGAAGDVHDMPCYGVATFTTAGTATVQAITDDTYQEHCVELATLIAIRIA